MPFKKLLDALTKGPALEEAFDNAGQMHERSKELFELCFKTALGEKKLAHEKLKDMDRRINKLERDIRREIYQYLVVASKPNVNASLILVSIVIDYERIGDLASNIAQTDEIFNFRLRDSKYLEEITEIEGCIVELFELTLKAFDREDRGYAKHALELHDRIKELHSSIISSLSSDQDVSVPEAMMVTSVCYYLRRINAHLSNINTTILLPFPSMGFASRALNEME